MEWLLTPSGSASKIGFQAVVAFHAVYKAP